MHVCSVTPDPLRNYCENSIPKSKFLATVSTQKILKAKTKQKLMSILTETKQVLGLSDSITSKRFVNKVQMSSFKVADLNSVMKNFKEREQLIRQNKYKSIRFWNLKNNIQSKIEEVTAKKPKKFKSLRPGSALQMRNVPPSKIYK